MRNYTNYLLLCSSFLIVQVLHAQIESLEVLDHDSQSREYLIYVPSSYQASDPTPLIFNFHGGGGDIQSQLWTSDMRSLAESERFIVVYPQALPDPNAYESYLWTHKEPTQVDDVLFVDALIEHIADQYSIDMTRIYACGYSNGGEFTFELACRLSDKISAIGVVARSIFIDTYDSCRPDSPVGVLSIHGTEDDYDGIEWLGINYYVSLDDANALWVDINDITASPIVEEIPDTNLSDGSTVTRFAWLDTDRCTSVEHLRVNGGGHDWPGTFGNQDINATEEIWNFVSRFRDGIDNNCLTSISDIDHPTVISVYPNPSHDYILITSPEGDTPYSILDINGQVISQGFLTTDLCQLDVVDFKAGLYFIQTISGVTSFVKM